MCGCSNPQIHDAILSESAIAKTVVSNPIDAFKITAFPERIDPNCRDGRAKLYDECSDQYELFTQAKLRAKDESKTVLVSYGGEWCLWCHVFDAYIHGEVNQFTYEYLEFGKDKRHTRTMNERAKRDVTKDALALKKYVSENFVVVHIDYERSSGANPDGDDILVKLGARAAYKGGAPYIFTADVSGTYAAQLDLDLIEVTREGKEDLYLGYDRVKLLEQLKTMRAAARS